MVAEVLIQQDVAQRWPPALRQMSAAVAEGSAGTWGRQVTPLYCLSQWQLIAGEPLRAGYLAAVGGESYCSLGGEGVDCL